MDVFGVELEVVNAFLSDAARSSLGEKLIVVAIVWWIMKRNVARHFENIEGSLSNIALSVNQLKESIIDLEVKQTERINDLHERVARLETK